VGYGYLIPRCLAQGSAPRYDVSHFDVVVLCAEELQDIHIARVETILCPLDDSGPPITQTEVAIAIKTAGRVYRRIKAGKRVLVTCHMGLNRSGLVGALTLRALGFTPQQSIRLVRATRGPEALKNRSFVRVIQSAVPAPELLRVAS